MVDEATLGQAVAKSTTSTLLRTALVEAKSATGARANKYSTDSWKPVKLPTGVICKVGFLVNRPAGTNVVTLTKGPTLCG